MNELERSEKLDELGRFLMQQVRDVSIRRLNGVFDPSKSFSLADRRFQGKIKKLNLGEDEIKFIGDIVTECIDDAISQLLFKFSSCDEGVERIGLSVDNTDIRDLSKNLQGYLYSEWFEKFSMYGEHSVD
jgi:hypothetical protein